MFPEQAAKDKMLGTDLICAYLSLCVMLCQQAEAQPKSWLYDRICQWHAARHAAASKNIATEMCRLQQASTLLQWVKQDSKTMSHDIQQYKKHCEEAVNGRLTIAEKVLEHPCAFKVGLNVVAVVLFVHLQCTNCLRFLFVVRTIHLFISKK